MLRFLVTRVFYMIIVMIAVSFIVFGLSRMSGDPRMLYLTPGSRWSQEVWDARGKELGLDKPFVIQYVIWASKAVRGDFGDSVWHKRNSMDVIIERAPATLKLSSISYIFAILLGLSLGILSAINRGNFFDIFIRGFALIGQAAPPFWIAIMLIYILEVNLDWVPTSTQRDWRNFKFP